VPNHNGGQVEQRRRSVGGQDIVDIVIHKVGERVSKGQMDGVFGSRFACGRSA
jgi:hypothetical protein